MPHVFVDVQLLHPRALDDRLLEIDGVTTAGLNLGEVIHRLRGRSGSQVVVIIERAGDDGGERQTLTMVMNRRPLRKVTDDDGMSTYERTQAGVTATTRTPQ